ncbi:MAG: hypothetical protein V4490_07805 [Pseudomonadota bacterium]
MKRYVVWAMLFFTAGMAYAVDLADVASGVYEPLKFVTIMMRYASYAVGFALFVGAISQFQLHRINPKLTPLMTPIFLLFLALAALFLPYISTMFGNSWSAEEQDARGTAGAIEQGESPVRRPTNRVAPPAESTYWGDAYSNK